MEQQLQTPAAGTGLEHWGTGGGSAAGAVSGGDGQGGTPPPAPRPVQQNEVQDPGLTLPLAGLESEDHSHHLKQWRLAWCLAVFTSG